MCSHSKFNWSSLCHLMLSVRILCGGLERRLTCGLTGAFCLYLELFGCDGIVWEQHCSSLLLFSTVIIPFWLLGNRVGVLKRKKKKGLGDSYSRGQSISSLLSSHAVQPSHCQDMGIHCIFPLRQANCPGLQRCSVTQRERERSCGQTCAWRSFLKNRGNALRVQRGRHETWSWVLFWQLNIWKLEICPPLGLLLFFRFSQREARWFGGSLCCLTVTRFLVEAKRFSKSDELKCCSKTSWNS